VQEQLARPEHQRPAEEAVEQPEKAVENVDVDNEPKSQDEQPPPPPPPPSPPNEQQQPPPQQPPPPQQQQPPPPQEQHQQRKDEHVPPTTPDPTAKFFSCDKGRQLDIALFNNNYCDCADQTDEPGTSACQNGQFFCPVDQKHIRSNMVNDGVCDCCCGADETEGLVRCADTCGQVRAEHQQRETRRSQGRALRAEYLRAGAQAMYGLFFICRGKKEREKKRKEKKKKQ
jgi:hypothetical protein